MNYEMKSCNLFGSDIELCIISILNLKWLCYKPENKNKEKNTKKKKQNFSPQLCVFLNVSTKNYILKCVMWTRISRLLVESNADRVRCYITALKMLHAYIS